jgi:hypothetical protein
MHLQAVIVPPRGAIEGALQITHSIFAAEPEPVVEEPKRGLLGRLKKPPPPTEVVPEVLWEPTPPEALFVRVGKFGSVTLTDTRALAKAIEAVAVEWPRPLLHVQDVTVGETAPFTVTARLGGEVDDLFGIFRNVLDVAKLQGFFLDRRSFRSEVPLGTVDVPEGAVVPEGLPGAVIPLEGPHWHATHLTLQRLTRVGDVTTYEEVVAIPLGVGTVSEGVSRGRQA